MKLIDLLVKELPKRGGFPKGANECVQDADGTLKFFDSDGLFFGVKHGWCGSPRGGFYCTKEDKIIGLDLCCDHSSAIITLSKYEAALAKNDGWIEWGGGECPVDESIDVDIRFEDGSEKICVPADAFIWQHDDDITTIIAYRLHRDINSRANDDRLQQDLNECIGQGVDMPEWNGDGLPPVGEKCVFFYDGPDWCWGDKLKNGDEVDIIAHFSARDDSQHCMVAAFTNKNNHHVQVYQAISGCFRPLRTEAEKNRDEAIEFIREIIDAKAVDPFNSARFIYECMMGGNIPGVKLESK